MDRLPISSKIVVTKKLLSVVLFSKNHVTVIIAFTLLLLNPIPMVASSIGPFVNRLGFLKTPDSHPTLNDTNVTWNDLKFTLLNKINGPKLHSNNDFHIIRATFAGPQHSASYNIHLIKDPDEFYHSERLSISTYDADTHYSCFYTGTITEIKNPTDDAAVSVETGLASFTTCHHDMGFEGILLLPNGEHFHVKPSFSFLIPHHRSHLNGLQTYVKNGMKTVNFKVLPHRATMLTAADGSPSKEHQRHQIVFKVAQKDLLEAAAKVQESYSEGNQYSETSVVDDYANAENLRRHDSTNYILRLTRSVKKTGGTNGNSKMAEKKPQKGGPGANNSGRVVDIAAFTDETMYNKWKERYGEKAAVKKINQFVMATISQANTMYQQKSMKEKISFRLVHMEIQKKRPQLINENNGGASKYLGSFCDYAAERNQNGKLWDHALMFTGLDILGKDGSNGVVGIAYTGGMCTNLLSCSMSEDNFLAPSTVAHEVGHSFKMYHDGEDDNTACNPEKYIMAAVAGLGQNDWSSCSMDNLKGFFSKGYDGLPPPTCLLKKNGKNGVTFKNRRMPGQVFTLKEQCASECGDCIPKRNAEAPYNDVCYQLYCQKRDGLSDIPYPTNPALEGSPCAKGKVCLGGKCK